MTSSRYTYPASPLGEPKKRFEDTFELSTAILNARWESEVKYNRRKELDNSGIGLMKHLEGARD